MQVTLDGNPVTAWKSEKAQALLAYLAVEAERPQRRERLAGLLWPDVPERRARTNLRRVLADLRQALGDRRAQHPFLGVTRQTIQFNRASDVWVDVSTFTRLCETVPLNLSATAPIDPHSVSRLEQALQLVRGTFLEGFSLPGSPAFEEWALLQGEHLRRAVLLARGRLADYYEEGEDYERALLHARHAVELEPWEEQAQRRLMRLLVLAGQRGAALAQYQACCRTLTEELGVEPQAETTALYRQILAGALGPGPLPHNLPTPLTPFVGRAQELQEVQGRLRDPACRLLTLVGAGGIGKSRLALQAAREMVHAGPRRTAFPQGVYHVPLVAVDSAAGLVPAIATALDFQFSGESSPSAGQRDPVQPREQLLNYLRGKRLLLVLDNFEHLLPPGVRKAPVADGATGLVIELLRAAPGVKLLITSRMDLQLQAEWIYPLAGLTYPTHDGVEVETVPPDEERYSAVALFAQAAQRVCPGFAVPREWEALVRICRLVEGMPLALELAAASLKTLPAGDIADEIERGLGILNSSWQDAEPRHRSMRAVFDHSWKLLPAAEREVLQRLAVLRGGFGVSAATAVAQASTPLLAALAERSLLHLTPDGRYHMHELLRQYALEWLQADAQEEVATRERHSAYYARFLQGRGKALQGGGQQGALAKLDLEIENARAAWDWAVARGEVERLDQALEGLCLFYTVRHRSAEGEAACRLAAEKLQAIARGAELRTLARVLAWQASFSHRLEPVEKAEPIRQLLAQSMELLERPELAEQDTRRERAFVLQQMGYVALGTDFKAAQRWYQQSLALYRALGDSWWMADTLYMLGDATALLASYNQAVDFLEESLELRRALGDRRGIAESLAYLCLGAAHREPSHVARFGEECIAILRESGDRARLAGVLYTVGLAVAVSGEFPEGYALLEESVAIHSDLGIDGAAAWVGTWSAWAMLHLGQYHRARRRAENVLEFFREKNQTFRMGCSLSVLGMAALAGAAYAEAVGIFEESIPLFRQLRTPEPLSRELANLGLAVLGLGDVARAQRHVAEALRLAHEIQLRSTIEYALAPLAPLLAALGQPERAVELYALASRYAFIANSRWFQDVAGRQVTAASATLPAEVVAEARERGEARDLDGTVAALLAEFQGGAEGQ
jgi:predicted ATPase/DNA-binding SARP family transcriptional activator